MSNMDNMHAVSYKLMLTLYAENGHCSKRSG